MTIEKLQRYSFVQLFQLSSFLGPAGKKQVLRKDVSFVYAMQHGISTNRTRASNCYVHPGYAWAMRREMFDRMGGLIEYSILGGGEIHFAYALFNRIHETIPINLHPDYRRLTKIWADRVAQLSAYGYSVSYLPIHLWHHWHGNRMDRGYAERW